ncbi:hypothetical protein LINPERPRIM_LOCUS14885, partial [Linum perenne]
LNFQLRKYSESSENLLCVRRKSTAVSNFKLNLPPCPPPPPPSPTAPPPSSMPLPPSLTPPTPFQGIMDFLHIRRFLRFRINF